ncbi:MAG: putative smile protein [Chthonomonadales bacterium]|nr:putative smile protein [Chthonomonadales bacterium]
MFRRRSQHLAVSILLFFGLVSQCSRAGAQQTTSQNKILQIENTYRECIRLDPSSLQAYLALADFFRRTSQTDKTLAILRDAAHADVTDAGTNAYFAELSPSGRSAEAAAVVALFAGKRKTKPSLYASLGQEFLTKGDLEQALRMCAFGQEALRNASNSEMPAPDLYLLEGDILARQERQEEAIAAWKKAAYATFGDLPAVKTALSRLTAGQPLATSLAETQAAQLFGRAQSMLRTNPNAALLQIQEAVRLNPHGGYRYRSLFAQCLAATGKREEAVKEMQEAVKEDPDDYALAALYRMLQDMNRTPEAIEALARSRKNRKWPGLYVQALRYLEQTGHLKDSPKEGLALTDMAIAGMKKHAYLSPSDTCAAYGYRGDILMLQRKPKEAQTQWRKVLELPVKDDFWKERARMNLAESGAPPVPGFEGAFSIGVTSGSPGAAQVHWMKARDYVKSADAAGQIREMREAIRLFPGYGYYYTELSSILQNQGLKEEALAELRNAARITQEDEYAYHLYEALTTSRRYEEAIEEAKKGALLPRHRTSLLYIVLGKYYLGKGAYEDALKMVAYGFEAEAARDDPDIFQSDLYALKNYILQNQSKDAATAPSLPTQK